MLLSCRPSRRARSVFVVCVRRPRPSFRACAVCVWRFIVLPRPRTSTRRVFLRAARPIARPGPGERARAARGPAAPHAAERVATVVHPSKEWARARRRAAPRLSSCLAEGQQLPAIAARRRAALQAAASERCVVESALPLWRDADIAHQADKPSFHPAWAGPPGAWSGPPGETRQVYRPGEYDCTALSVQLRHQGRLTCSGERRRGPRNHEDGRIDGVARPGDVLPRAGFADAWSTS